MTSLYEQSNESIEINTLNTNNEMKIIYLSMMYSYYKPASMTYELNVMELYTEHQ